jgi:xanthine dehydrogenase accessory factor
MTHALEAPLAPLVRDFHELKSRGAAIVLATVVATEGSTYRKIGTQMLITERGQLHGLLSGGCLEVDLVEHAREVLATGRPALTAYDMRGEDDRLFGIGSGCEGAMRILLQRVGPAEDWQPLAEIAARIDGRERTAIALVASGEAAGRGWWDGGGSAPWPEPAQVGNARAASAGDAGARFISCRVGGAELDVLLLPLAPPPLLLLCGAGVDAVPLARLGVALGFAVTVCDHRPALAIPSRFPECALRCQPADEFQHLPELERCTATIVMSHQFAADVAYLSALADRPSIRYVGLLGPPPRRDRLMRELGSRAAALAGRLHAPVGLDIGARTPEAIALATAAELHAWIAGAGSTARA